MENSQLTVGAKTTDDERKRYQTGSFIVSPVWQKHVDTAIDNPNWAQGFRAEITRIMGEYVEQVQGAQAFGKLMFGKDLETIHRENLELKDENKQIKEEIEKLHVENEALRNEGLQQRRQILDLQRENRLNASDKERLLEGLNELRKLNNMTAIKLDHVMEDKQQ